jgi:hypothetical protein
MDLKSFHFNIHASSSFWFVYIPNLLILSLINHLFLLVIAYVWGLLQNCLTSCHVHPQIPISGLQKLVHLLLLWKFSRFAGQICVKESSVVYLDFGDRFNILFSLVVLQICTSSSSSFWWRIQTLF